MESLTIIEGSKQERYEALLPQVKTMMSGEIDDIANMANVAAMLHDTFHFWWTGFYRVVRNPEGARVAEELVLGPFQGPLACTRIRKGRGVCGTAWAKNETQVVPDVEQFPGHIACSSASQSEIVVPVRRNGEIIAVLDIDSEHLSTFDYTDRRYLEELVKMFEK